MGGSRPSYCRPELPFGAPLVTRSAPPGLWAYAALDSSRPAPPGFYLSRERAQSGPRGTPSSEAPSTLQRSVFLSLSQGGNTLARPGAESVQSRASGCAAAVRPRPCRVLVMDRPGRFGGGRAD